MQTIVEKARKEFRKFITLENDQYGILIHIPEAEKWANLILKNYPEIDREVISLAIWLHDIGQYPVTGVDHAIVSEERARKFLEAENYDPDRRERVLHIIRSHRNRDVVPESLEAKLFAVIDSSSHFTFAPYIDMYRNGKGQLALEKLERDYRDLKTFPEIEKKLKPVYLAWKSLLESLDKIKL